MIFKTEENKFYSKVDAIENNFAKSDGAELKHIPRNLLFILTTVFIWNKEYGVTYFHFVSLESSVHYTRQSVCSIENS